MKFFCLLSLILILVLLAACSDGTTTANTVKNTNQENEDQQAENEGQSAQTENNDNQQADKFFTPLLSYDMADETIGSDFLNWKYSTYDDTHAVSHGISVKVSTDPGELLPACSGSHFFAGRTLFDEDKRVTPGHILWYRIMLYIPGTFSFGYKYTRGNEDEALACRQERDGNLWLKWLVVSPTNGTGRIYLSPMAAHRSLARDHSKIRLVSEAAQKPGDFDVDFASLPRDRWFALQMAIKVSSDPDGGYIRAWIDDELIGQINTKTFDGNSSTYDWGIGNYWNGVPWTDGAAGRTDFWIDEIMFATDMPGYGAPSTVDSEGHPYIPSHWRAEDF